jgi:hypothetical protein
MTESTDSGPPSDSSALPTQGENGSSSSNGSTNAPTPAFAAESSGNRAVWLMGLILLLILVLALLIAFVGALRHWFALHTGTLHGGPDIYYNFWSGFGSDLGEATLISTVGIGVYTGVRKVNCHTKGCWRIGHHALAGTPYTLCRHHHPEVPNHGATHELILTQHHKFKLEQEAKRKD